MGARLCSFSASFTASFGSGKFAEIVHFPAFSFCRASGTRITLGWSGVEEQIIFLLSCGRFRGEILIKHLGFGGGAAPFAGLKNLYNPGLTADYSRYNVGWADLACGLGGADPVYTDFASFDQAACLGAGFYQAGEPKPFVQALCCWHF